MCFVCPGAHVFKHIAAGDHFSYLSRVKKAVAFLLLSLYMLSFSEFHQFLKMPVLVQHFLEHRQQDRTISFWSFLEEHYIHQYVVDDDYQRDNQLPFRDTDCCIVTLTLSCECPVPQIIAMTGDVEEVQQEFNLYEEKDFSLLQVADIFQPPRLA